MLAILECQQREIQEKDQKIQELINQIESLTNVTKEQLLKGCVLTIEHPLVSLREKPNTRSLKIMKVEPAKYAATEYVLTRRGNHEEGWFKVKIGTKEGWINNDTWSIEAKTNSCP